MTLKLDVPSAPMTWTKPSWTNRTGPISNGTNHSDVVCHVLPVKWMSFLTKKC